MILTLWTPLVIHSSVHLAKELFGCPGNATHLAWCLRLTDEKLAEDIYLAGNIP